MPDDELRAGVRVGAVVRVLNLIGWAVGLGLIVGFWVVVVTALL